MKKQVFGNFSDFLDFLENFRYSGGRADLILGDPDICSIRNGQFSFSRKDYFAFFKMPDPGYFMIHGREVKKVTVIYSKKIETIIFHMSDLDYPQTIIVELY